jgi:hypothetical protein
MNRKNLISERMALLRFCTKSVQRHARRFNPLQASIPK